MHAMKRVGPFALMALLVSTATFVLPRSAMAQVGVDLIPFFGSYYSPSTTGFTLAGSTLEETHENVLAVGGALGVQFTQVLGFEARATFIPSGIRVAPTGDERQTEGAQGGSVSGTVFSADGLIRLHAPRTNFYGLAGAGIVSRAGDAWSGFEGLTDVEFVAGAGVRARVTQNFRLDIRVEGHFYAFEPTPPGGSTYGYDSKLMPDFLINIGVPIPLR